MFLLLGAALLAALLMVTPFRAGVASADANGDKLLAGPTLVRVGQTTANVAAWLDPDGPTTYWFEYGPTTAYGSETPARTHDGTAGLAVGDSLAGLTPGSEYHVRLVARVSQTRRSNGDDTRFTTSVEPSTELEPAPEPTPGPSEEPVPAPADPVAPPAPPAEAAPQPEPAPQPAPAPEQGKAVVAAAVSGEVRVKLPGGGYQSLSDVSSVPVGAVVDAREGRIALSSETAAGTQTGEFWGAVFQVRQDRAGRGMTELHLRGGSFAACGRQGNTVARAAGKRRKAVRSLWGKDKGGKFKTHGRDSVATVRGTTWQVTDRCDGTLTRVTAGAVVVRDRHTGRSTVVRAGERHLARHR